MHHVAWIAGYPRSGLGRLASMLAAYILDDRAPTADAEQDAVPDLVRAYAVGKMLPMAGDRTVAAKLDFLPGVEVLRPYQEVTGKVVYTARDLREVLLSTLRVRRPALDQARKYAQGFIDAKGVPGRAGRTRGTWAQHTAEWTSLERLHRHFPHAEVRVVRYDDLDRDPAGTIAEVAEFLGLGGAGDTARAERAVKNSSPDWIDGLRRKAAENPYRDGRPQPPAQIGPLRSLSDLGEDIEDAYRRLVEEDPDVRRLTEELTISK